MFGVHCFSRQGVRYQGRARECTLQHICPSRRADGGRVHMQMNVQQPQHQKLHASSGQRRLLHICMQLRQLPEIQDRIKCTLNCKHTLSSPCHSAEASTTQLTLPRCCLGSSSQDYAPPPQKGLQLRICEQLQIQRGGRIVAGALFGGPWTTQMS